MQLTITTATAFKRVPKAYFIMQYGDRRHSQNINRVCKSNGCQEISRVGTHFGVSLVVVNVSFLLEVTRLLNTTELKNNALFW